MKAVDEWIETLATIRQEETVKSYRYSAQRFVAYLQERGVNRFNEVQAEHVLAYQRSLRRLKPAAVRRELAALISLFRWARRAEHTKIVIGDLVEKPAKPPARVEYLTEEEERLLETSWQKFRPEMQFKVKVLLTLLMCTGSRIGGIHYLNIEDIDFHRAAIRVRQKGGRYIWLPMLHEVRDVLDEYIQHEDRGSGPLLLNRYDGRWQIAGMRRTIKECGKRVGITRNIYPHLFRHTYATKMLRRGLDIRYLQEALGQEDIRSTQIYAHVDVEDLRAKLEAVEESKTAVCAI